MANVEREVYIDLILQFYYVGLDKPAMPDSTTKSSESTTAHNTNNSNDPLNDNMITEGDEHIRQIIGGL